jgi:hypothetical protein
MAVSALQSRRAIDTDRSGGARARRVMVLFEPGRTSEAALREAGEAAADGGELTVVTLAPQAHPGGCVRCRAGAFAYNCAVREEAALDLSRARELLGPAADRAAFKTLVERRDPPLAAWVDEQLFDLVVLPARRLALRGHPAAPKLRRTRTAELRVVG